MVYLIGVILVILLIALVLVLRPPKLEQYQDTAQKETAADVPKEVDDERSIDAEHGAKETAEVEDGLELTLDDTPGTESPGRSTQAAEEELDLTFGAPAAEKVAEPLEDFELTLEKEGDEEQPEATVSSADAPGESISLTEKQGRDEYDEDIPFIDDGEGAYEREREVDVAPALADVPDDFAKVEEDETPDELAERLEFFLGTDDKETEPEAEESAAERDDDAAGIVDEPETVDETVEAEPVVEEESEAGSDGYRTDLQEQEERLRSEMNAAIESREIGKLGLLENALESLCLKQADIEASFQQQQNLLDELDGAMNEVQQALPGFQLETVRSSLRDGEYEVVGTLLTEAAGQLDGFPQLASKVLYQWGRIEEERGELAAALEIYGKARSGDDENFDYLYGAGRLARITGDTDNAVSWLEKRVKSGKEQGEESVELAKAEHELAKALAMDEKNDRVEPLLSSAREIIEKLLGNAHPDLGPVLYDLGGMYDRSARYEQAEPMYKQALELIEKNFGRADPRLGATLYKLAGLYEEIEKEKEAESLYTRALEIKQKVLGENHPDVGNILNSLANLLKLQGKYDQAEPMFIKSLAIAEVALGKDHPNLAVVLNDMAELYGEMGNEERAEHFQERAFSLFGLPGADSGFVEMDKDTDYEAADDKDQTVTGSS